MTQTLIILTHLRAIPIDAYLRGAVVVVGFCALILLMREIINQAGD